MTPAPPGLHVESTGSGAPIVVMHGAGEDTRLMGPQARALADRGFRAITYDRRGTGRSSRVGWPSGGVPAHVADAAALVRSLGDQPVRVLGFSSGGTLAIAFACSHPALVTEAIAWEPAALGVLPDGDRLHEMLMAPVRSYLDTHPGDWRGAYDVMLTSISGGRADLSDPTVQAMRRNADAALRDDAEVITRHRFSDEELTAAPTTIAQGEGASGLHAMVADRLAEMSGRPTWTVPGIDDHEVYLHRPEVLADAIRSHS